MEIKIIPGLIWVIVMLTCIYYLPWMVRYRRSKKWDKSIRAEYIKSAHDLVDHQLWYQKIKQWLYCYEAQDYYVFHSDSEFLNMFNLIVESTKKEVVEELKQKYANEYKSRNKKSTDTV